MLSFICGVFYRMGGSGNFNRAFRIWGCPAFIYGALFLWWLPKELWMWLLLLPAYGLTGGALSTYWSKEGADEKWYNYLLHGFFIALACFPFYWAGISWYSILIRAFIVGGLVSWVSTIMTWDIGEEWSRGFLCCLFPYILLI